ncbi:MAG: insulinase family protein [Crocinitomicaceae bacterium]|nr:insulinase family protein [Crocinitomicaceae bacterium]
MKKLIIALGLITPALLFGQLDRSVVPSAAPAKAISIADPVVFKTANGITVILSENHKIPKVTFSLAVGNGDRIEGKKAGLSNIAGDLILSGTSNRSKDEIDAKKDYIGASINAGARNMSLSCLTKHMDTGLEIFSDILLNANFPASEFDRIVKQAESGLMAVKSSPESMGNNALMTSLFAGHPYGEVMTESTLKNITRDDVVNYFKQTFVPEGSYLVIVGDITKEKAEEVVNKYFASWSGSILAKVDYPSAKNLKGNRVIFVKKPGAVQSYIQVAFPVDVKVGDANYIPVSLTNHIFGGNGFGTRLMQNLREDKAYTYGAYSSLSIQQQGAYVAASGSFRNDVTDSAIVELIAELNKLTNSYVTDEELSLAKAVLTGRFARSLESPATIARFALEIERYGLDKNFYKDYLKNLDAVDKEKVLDMAQKFYTDKNCYIIVVGNESVLDKLKQFDADGRIEVVDAFGEPVQDMKKADISADELFQRYAMFLTNTKDAKTRNKVLKKFKSVTQNISMSVSQIPFPLKSVSFWGLPNSEVMTIEAQGMVVQKTYFDGKTGYSSNMQTGKTDLTTEEIAAKNKSTGLIPEISYAISGMKYEMLGIENQNGTDMYVVQLNDGESESFEYFSTSDYRKIKTITINTKGGEDAPGEITKTYSDYKEVNGVKFPHKIVMSAGAMTFSGEVESIEINKKTIENFK